MIETIVQWDAEFMCLTASSKKLLPSPVVLAMMLYNLLPEGDGGGGVCLQCG